MNRRSIVSFLAVLPLAGVPFAARPQAREIFLSFEVDDAYGRKISENDFKGSWLIVYFGYTSCPDVCPVSLFKFQAVADELKKSGIPLEILFVSVDPERDTDEVLKEYARVLGPNVHAATGNKETLDAVTKEFQVRYEIENDTDRGGYIVSHTTSSRLIDPTGKFRSIIPADAEVNEIVGFIQARTSQ